MFRSVLSLAGVLLLSAASFANVALPPSHTYTVCLIGDPSYEKITIVVSSTGSFTVGDDTFYRDYESGMYSSPTSLDIWEFDPVTTGVRHQGNGESSGPCYQED